MMLWVGSCLIPPAPSTTVLYAQTFLGGWIYFFSAWWCGSFQPTTNPKIFWINEPGFQMGGHNRLCLMFTLCFQSIPSSESEIERYVGRMMIRLCSLIFDLFPTLFEMQENMSMSFQSHVVLLVMEILSILTWVRENMPTTLTASNNSKAKP